MSWSSFDLPHRRCNPDLWGLIICFRIPSSSHWNQSDWSRSSDGLSIHGMFQRQWRKSTIAMRFQCHSFLLYFVHRANSWDTLEPILSRSSTIRTLFRFLYLPLSTASALSQRISKLTSIPRVPQFRLYPIPYSWGHYRHAEANRYFLCLDRWKEKYSYCKISRSHPGKKHGNGKAWKRGRYILMGTGYALSPGINILRPSLHVFPPRFLPMLFS